MADDAADESGNRKSESAAERRDRLAAQLRRNLARRKAQGRARRVQGDVPDPGAGPEDA